MKNTKPFSGRVHGRWGRLAGLSVVSAALAWMAAHGGASADPLKKQIFEINVTNDLNLGSGEPEIAIDPTNPRHLSIMEFPLGDASHPAYTLNPFNFPPSDPTFSSVRLVESWDFGQTWVPGPRPGPLNQPPLFNRNPFPLTASGDPMVDYGPDGTLYIGADELNFTNGTPNFPASGVGITFSTDRGKHFAPPQLTGSPEDRPWLKVDQDTGNVYTVSSGNFNAATGELDTPGSGIADRWLVAWNRDLSVKSGLRRLGGPDFSGAGGSTLVARFGIVAATFVLSAGPVPASLTGLITDGTTTCTSTKPCLFFETSMDEGVTWERHFISVPGGFSSRRANVSADPTRQGSYAVGVLNIAATQFLVFLTEDYGNTWRGPYSITETAAGTDFKQWMDYGPTGVLGFMWKRSRPDLPAPPLTADLLLTCIRPYPAMAANIGPHRSG